MTKQYAPAKSEDGEYMRLARLAGRIERLELEIQACRKERDRSMRRIKRRWHEPYRRIAAIARVDVATAHRIITKPRTQGYKQQVRY